MGFLEVIGIASILPFMQLMAEPNAIQKSTWLNAAYDFFQFNSPKQMLLYSGFGIIMIIGIANAFSVFAIWLQYKYSWGIAHKLSMRLLQTYLSKPYPYYLQNNTSNLQAYITAEAGRLTGEVIIPIIEICSRSLIAIVILSVLVLVDMKVALIMFGGLGSAYLLIYFSQKNYLRKVGEYRIKMNISRYKNLKELFDGIKTIMVHNQQNYFYNRYEHASFEFCNVQPKYNLFLAAPRSALEFLAFGSILAITMYLYITSGNIQSALPRLSLFAVAGYRLLPALQKVFSSIAKLRHSFPIVEKLYEDLQPNHPSFDAHQNIQSIPFNHTLELGYLHFSYNNTDESIIDNLNIKISKGETIAFVGSTGSGKTTLVDMIVGLLSPTNGNIKVDNIPLTPANAQGWQQQLAYVPQEVFLFDDSVLNNLTFGHDKKEVDFERLEKATRLANIHRFIVDQLAEGYETKIGERGVRLSGGQRQRLGLARALYQHPSVLVLDEATSALDGITENQIIESLKTLPNDITTIIIAHRLSTVKHADCIYILDNGKIVAQGNYESLFYSNESFKTMVDLS